MHYFSLSPKRHNGMESMIQVNWWALGMKKEEDNLLRKGENMREKMSYKPNYLNVSKEANS